MLVGMSVPPPSVTIALPVSAHFDLVLEMFGCQMEGTGWWRSAVISTPQSSAMTSIKRYLAVQVPQGIAAADLCVVVSPWRTRILLIGFGGGLSDDLSLGDTVVATRAVTGSGRGCRLSVFPSLSGHRRAVLGFAPLLMDHPHSWVNHQVREGVDVLDMETVPMATIARRYGVAFSSALVISDLPHRMPLCAVPANAWENAHSAIARLLRMAVGGGVESPARKT